VRNKAEIVGTSYKAYLSLNTNDFELVVKGKEIP
jgi:hypothetical protein